MNTKKQEPIVHLTAGAISGLTSCVLLQPFELVKTRLQQQQQRYRFKNDSRKSLNR
jgi:solute carrier family 25 protein 38